MLHPIALWGRTSLQSLRQSSRRPTGYCEAIAVRQFFAGVGSRELQVRAAEELTLLPDGSAIAELLSDYAVMRDQARACVDGD